ncbi:TonB-dependent receptor plug domain-containing protein [Inhella sp.]|uniref:TonB-dependent receptor n=1 Tax=Inhella sp. TaxID=1921806 RepID=UPI0035B1116A
MKRPLRPRAFARLSRLTLATVVCLASGATWAQQSTGSISGKAAKGDLISVENKVLGLNRQSRQEDDGSFQLGQLPPGTYRVTLQAADGSQRSAWVVVQAGEGAVARFVDQLARVEVSGGSQKTLDVTATESAQVLTKAQLDRIPVARDVTSVTLLAPGSVQGDSRIGQTNSRVGFVPSLGGASPAENTYYINGFNVTNIVNGVAFNQVPYEAVAEQRVATGGYGAEFGRSLGGVISVNTKRGTNEWQGGFNIKHNSPEFQSASVRTYRDPTTNRWVLIERPGSIEQTSVNVWGGGPLIENKLFVFAMVQATHNTTETYFSTTQTRLRNNTPQYLVKLDWNVSDNHLFELTAFSDKSEDRTQTWDSPQPYQTAKGDDKGENLETTGGTNVIAKWTSWITDDLSISALAGLGKYDRSSKVAGGDCPVVVDLRTSTRADYGCWTATSLTNPDANDERTALRLDAEWTLGKHRLKAGLDHEIYKVLDGSQYPGNAQYVLRTRQPGQLLPNGYRIPGTPGVDPAVQIVDQRLFRNGGSFKTVNSAWYVEDNVQVTDRLLLSAGLRNESFTNSNAVGTPFIDVKNTWAPRFGAAWDVHGDAQLKVYGNLGRYFIPVYSNTNLRLAGSELDYREYFQYTGALSSDRFQIPGKGAQLGSRLVNSSGEPPNPLSVVDPKLKPMYQDEFIAGIQKAFANRWSVGLKYTHRKLGSGMDDICDGLGPEAWALANGYTAAQAEAIKDAIDHCFLYNPGKNLTANIDLNGDGQLREVVIPAVALKMPVAKRNYDAVEISFERAWDKRWSLQGSYVLSYSKGNTEGYVKSDSGQDDAGITADFDAPGLMEGAYGYLPNDRRHTFKLFGSYAASDAWRVGASLIAQSGRPRNCFGVYAGTNDPRAAGYGDASFFCDGKPTPRGSQGRLPWTQQINLQATYTPKAVKGLTLSADLLNLLNQRGVRSMREEEGSGMNDINSRYGEPIGVQPARSLRLLAQYEF